MLPYTTNPHPLTDRSRYIYDLSSAVIHKGKLEAGHYYAYCRQGDQVCFPHLLPSFLHIETRLTPRSGCFSTMIKSPQRLSPTSLTPTPIFFFTISDPWLALQSSCQMIHGHGMLSGFMNFFVPCKVDLLILLHTRFQRSGVSWHGVKTVCCYLLSFLFPGLHSDLELGSMLWIYCETQKTR